MYARHWLRTIDTVRTLRPRQIFYYAWRRGIGARYIAPINLTSTPRKIHFPASTSCEDHARFGKAHRFCFLNRTLEFPRSAMDWNPAQVDRLWRYHLHYFGFLGDSERALDEKCALINDWIARNPAGSLPAWEPYPVSLRIVNWCKFLWSLPGEQQKQSWLLSLFNQARWLEHNVEYHILANHLFENLKALVFAGAAFEGESGHRWLERGQKELICQLQEQQLSDGGHYERSPLYHCIIIEGCLDLLNLGQANPGLLKKAFMEILERFIRRGLDWLERVSTPDDDIPLFNDSAHNASSRPSRLMSYAQRLGFTTAEDKAGLIDLPASGLYGWKNGLDYFLVDCGDIGPAYQPGHTHCDFLSYVWMTTGRWLVVDTGLCNYEPGRLRTLVRSTAAHNTIAVDDTEQSDIWGAFRVGRRARRLSARLLRDDSGVTFEGAFRGFPRLGGIVHHRRAHCALNSRGDITALHITDRIEGKGFHTVDSFIHFHPDVELERRPSGILLKRSDGFRAELYARSGSIEIIPGIYCPEFGKSLANRMVRIRMRGRLPLGCGYSITRLPAE